MIVASGIIADKFMKGKILIKSTILTEKMPTERISGDKILTFY